MGYEKVMIGGEEELSFANHSDPLVFELNRLQNKLKEKNREVAAAQAEIKGLRVTEVLKDKALEELRSEVEKLDEKLRATENLVEQKNLEMRKVTNEKKNALIAQYAAEATLRRVHANQKDDDPFPIDLIIAPFEAEIKMYKNEVASLQDDRKALERLTKSKELALLEAEQILQTALERALIVEEVQNQNFELKRQMEIFQEENKILEKTNRLKIVEVEKLSQTIQELEEAILASGVAANDIRDYRRRISELNAENRTLERELARVKVSANRVATVVANEWKDEKGWVMPVKQWLEERKLFQAEMLRLKEKLAISVRTAKAEAQLKEKFKSRLKTIEEGLKHSSLSANACHTYGSPETQKTTNGGLRKRSPSQLKALYTDKRRMGPSRNRGIDSSDKENMKRETNMDNKIIQNDVDREKMKDKDSSNEEFELKENQNGHMEDAVSGFLYDRIQKELIGLRKACEVKDCNLNSKDEEIQVLRKKVDALTRATEVESKKVKREAASKAKESQNCKTKDTSSFKRQTSLQKNLEHSSVR